MTEVGNFILKLLINIVVPLNCAFFFVQLVNFTNLQRLLLPVLPLLFFNSFLFLLLFPPGSNNNSGFDELHSTVPAVQI